MGTYASETSVSADKSRAEIEHTLQRYGATAFMYGWDVGRAVLAFELKQRRYRILIPLPDRNDNAYLYTPGRRQRRSQSAAFQAWEQATRQRWRAAALWIKAVLEAAESGIISVEQALQPFTLLPSGQTIGEWMEPQIEQVYETGSMPPLLPGGR